MATTTPNFGWPVPTSTDLVKDGATAMEALGDAIDTSMVDLKGGTTGQVLSKNSNTDMDFVWVTDAGGDITGVTAGTGISGGGTSGTVTVTNSMATTITTKGDLVPGTGSGTFARLAVGNNGETLVADSSATTGLRYQGSMAGGKNAVINGGFDIWQRGTSFTSLGAYVADRWYWGGTGTGRTISRQTGTAGCQYAIRLQRDSGNTSTSALAIGSSMEIAQATPLQGKTITVSFYAKAGANYSGASSQLTVQLSTGTSSTETNRMLVAYPSGDATPLNDAATLTTSWQRFSYNVTLASNVTQFFLYFQTATLSGTAGAADYVDITGAQIEVGSVATNFTRAGGTIQGELGACQRYYWRSNIGSNTNAGIGWGFTYSATAAYMLVKLPISMRVPPTSIEFAALSLENWGGTVYTCSNVTLSQANVDMIRVQTTNSGMTGQQYANMFLTSGTTYLAASAEL